VDYLAGFDPVAFDAEQSLFGCNACGPDLGVDVMITIFCDFRQFSAKKMEFFSKTNVMIKILLNLALF
jgi:hypothetical protein